MRMVNDASKVNEKLSTNGMKLCWKKLDTEQQLKAREGHCACVLHNKLYIFGGVCHGQDGEMEELDEFLVFDVASRKCERLQVSGELPVGRCGAALVSVADDLYLFGGLNHSQGWLNDLHRFDPKSRRWSRVHASGDVPSARDKVSSVVIKNKLFVFGGFGPYSHKQVLTTMEDDADDKDEDDDDDEEDDDDDNVKFGWFNDLFAYDVVLNQWKQLTHLEKAPSRRAAASMVAVEGLTLFPSITPPSISPPPSSTMLPHGAVSAGDGASLPGGGTGVLVMFGGRDKAGRLNDLHIFDIDKGKWRSDLQVKGMPPAPRSFHCSVGVGRRMVVCGGRGADDDHFADTNVLDLEEMQWSQPEVAHKYEGRGLMVGGVVGGMIVIFGGSSSFDASLQQCRKLYNDFYVLNADDLTEEE